MSRPRGSDRVAEDFWRGCTTPVRLLAGRKDENGIGESTLMESLVSGVDSRARLRLAEGVFRFCPNFVGARSVALARRAAGVSIGKACMFFGFPRLSGPGDLCARLRIGSDCG